MQNSKKRNNETKCLLIGPERRTTAWFKEILTADMWEFVERWPKGSNLFTSPNKDSIHEFSKRKTLKGTEEVMLAL